MCICIIGVQEGRDIILQSDAQGGTLTISEIFEKSFLKFSDRGFSVKQFFRDRSSLCMYVLYHLVVCVCNSYLCACIFVYLCLCVCVCLCVFVFLCASVFFV